MEGTGAAKVAYSCNKGNYKGYYKMRPESNNRLQYLLDEWFRSKACLDVGCNDGQFCITLAETFVPAYILGIDPDFVLIDSAQSRLKRLLYAENQKTVASVSSAQIVTAGTVEPKPKPVVAFRSGFLPRALAVKAPVKRRVPATLPTDVTTSTKTEQTTSESTTSQTASTNTSTASVLMSTTTFPHNVVFKARDIFDLSCTLSSQKEGKYDTITCFSVSKWVHLNGGDSKLLEFFCRLYSLVRCGGRVIIEYQPWKSYENNKGTSDTTKAIFPTIQIKPDLFEWVLTFIVGFEIEARRGVHLDHAKGFDRPILVLRRPVSSGAAGVSGSGNSASSGTGAATVSTSSNSNINNSIVVDSAGGAGAGTTSKSSKKTNTSNTDGFRDGKKLWENVNSFAALCNIVYKRIQRGTVVSISNTSGVAGAVGSSGIGGGNSSGKCSVVNGSVGTADLVSVSVTNTDVGVNVGNDNATVSSKRTAAAMEETVPSDEKKSKKSKKADY